MEENKNILKDEDIDENNEQKKIEVITGDGDLNISPVYDHIEVEKTKAKRHSWSDSSRSKRHC